MDVLNFLWDRAVPFLVVLTVLIFVHELGHYWVARRNGVRIEVFSIGFGPELFGWTDRHNTRWKISALPFGGYVKMFGEGDGYSDTTGVAALSPADQAVSFSHKRLGQRAAIVAAGPIANYLFAIVALAFLLSVAGNPMPLAAVGTIVTNSAAERAGLKVGDRIVAIDGRETEWFEDMRSIVSASPGRELSLDVDRAGQRLVVKAVPDNEASVGRLGVTPDSAQVAHQLYNPFTATVMAVERTAMLSWQILVYLGEVVTGSRGTEELGGPLRIAQMSGEMAQVGWSSLLFFMAALSINLGLINLFPIPPLDGGHLAYFAAEAIRGRPLPARTRDYGFRVGMVLVLLLLVFATWNDLTRHTKVIQYIRDLIT